MEQVKAEFEYGHHTLQDLLGPEWESLRVSDVEDGSRNGKHMLVGQTKAGRQVSVEIKLPTWSVMSEETKKAQLAIIRHALVNAVEELRKIDVATPPWA